MGSRKGGQFAGQKGVDIEGEETQEEVTEEADEGEMLVLRRA